jgi:ribulose-phosphate 3-epimerase
MKSLILPSLLAADMGKLADEAKRAEDAGADALHLDIMDGHFVPNISMGPAVVAMAKKHLSIPLNVHLMLTRPDKYIKAFADAGADSIQIHIESDCDATETISKIRALGVSPGIVINPATSADDIIPLLPIVDEVLCMTVNPGYGGQSFMPGPLDSIQQIWEAAKNISKDDLVIMIDGGINAETALLCAERGANAFVAGTFLFGATDMPAEILKLRESTTKAHPSFK